MAKKVVATLRQKGASKMAKVIKMVKSEKTGAYTFVEDVIAVENAADFFEVK